MPSAILITAAIAVSGAVATVGGQAWGLISFALGLICGVIIVVSIRRDRGRDDAR